MYNRSEKSKTVLLLEHERNDEQLVLVAIERAHLDCDVIVLRDGEAAFDYFLRLRNPRTRNAVRRPDLVLLNWNLPKLDGGRLLRQLSWTFRDTEGLLSPIVVLFNGAETSMLAEAYRYGARAVIKKSPSVTHFVQALEETVRFWLVTNVMPPLTRGMQRRDHPVTLTPPLPAVMP